MLASIVIDHLWISFCSNKAGIAYMFCDYRKPDEQTLVNLFGSLLRQLVEQQISISDDVKNLCSLHQKQKTRPGLEEVLKVLKSELTEFAAIFVVIDALDECADDYGVRQRLIEEIHDLKTSTSLNLMTTSRPIPHIVSQFPDVISLEIRASEKDIESYLNAQMTRLPMCVKKSKELQESIINSIVKSVDGMYVLPILHSHNMS